MESSSTELYHYGVLGMKWGVRKDPYNSRNDSAKTKQAKRDLEQMSDQEFMNKYSVSKQTYRKRVEKYGDPARNSPLARVGNKLSGKKNLKKTRLPTKVEKKSSKKTFESRAKN